MLPPGLFEADTAVMALEKLGPGDTAALLPDM